MKEMEVYLSEARLAAKKAGLHLKKNLRKESRVEFKGEVDLVTDSDRTAQELIFGHLSSVFPGHHFLAEEGLEKDGESPLRWVIDPLDGTTNFAHGFPVFAVSIALEKEGRPLLGVVYDPMRNELFWAARGRGAFLDGKPVRVSHVRELDKSLLATGFPYDVRESADNNMDHFNRFLVRAQAIRRCGSAAMDLCYIACGRFDGFWELKLHPWDTAAGSLIVEEAGGRVTDFQGNPFSIYGTEVLATNGWIHQEMAAVLQMGKAHPERRCP